jgi:hypothetical protein
MEDIGISFVNGQNLADVARRRRILENRVGGARMHMTGGLGPGVRSDK